MQRRLESLGGEGPHIIFAHANGYPPGSYRRFLNRLAVNFRLTGFHHRPMWSPEMPPQRANWSRFSEDVIETLEATQDEPVWMMGHSMGSTIATIAASQRPDLFRGLVLIDPVFMSTRRALATRLVPKQRLRQAPMIRKTLSRPNRFVNHEEAFRFHRDKRVFSNFTDEVLWDYILAGTRATDDGEVQLAYAREWEAAVYMSTPWIWRRLARISLPVLGLRGETSDTLTPRAFRRWRRLQPDAVLQECPGGHLLPMEYPDNTARVVTEYLLDRC